MNTWCCRIEVIKSNNWRASFLLTSVPLTVDSKVFKSGPSCVCQKTKTILELFLNYIMMVKHQLNSIQKVLRVCCQSISPFVSCALKFICSQNLNSQYLKRKITDINFWNEFGFSFYSIQCLIRCKIQNFQVLWFPFDLPFQILNTSTLAYYTMTYKWCYVPSTTITTCMLRG